MTEHEFIIEQQKAVERMKKMATSSAEKNNNESQTAQNTSKDFFPSKIDINLFNRLKNDKDVGLILSLLLILYSEKSDKLLMFALLYILL